MTVKFFIRRLIVAPLVVLFTASAWFGSIAALVGLGAAPTGSPAGVWQLGLIIGGLVSLVFLFSNYKRVS
jgi:hypothetical protein